MNLIAGLTAFFLGAMHVLEPGHGKTAIAAYAVGHRSGLRHILILGLSTAVAHTATILILALILGAAVSTVGGEDALRRVEIISGSLLLVTGAWLWRRALKQRRAAGDHTASDENECGCHRTNSEAVGDEKNGVSFGAVGLLGISVGLLPCPTALAVLIASMTTGHFYGGLWTVCLFSGGIALTVSGVALAAFFFAGSPLAARIENRFGKSNWARNLPILTAWIVIGSGFFTLYRAILHQ
jgi:nickel/cobalt exporter